MPIDIDYDNDMIKIGFTYWYDAHSVKVKTCTIQCKYERIIMKLNI